MTEEVKTEEPQINIVKEKEDIKRKSVRNDKKELLDKNLS